MPRVDDAAGGRVMGRAPRSRLLAVLVAWAVVLSGLPVAVVGAAPAGRATVDDVLVCTLATIKGGWNLNSIDTWFQSDSYTRDAVGNVTQIVDSGVEASGTGSTVKECFLYDQWNRLVRAHSATPATACATSTAAATVATGSRDPYDSVWSFDDINRTTSRADRLAGVTTTFAYPASGGVRPHALTGATGGGVAVAHSYNAFGAMSSRDTNTGDATPAVTMGYDTQQRLSSYGSVESYLYGTSNQRLIRTAGATRTLYLPGIEVTATGATRTVTRFVAIGGAQIATVAPDGSIAWNCASAQQSTVCQAPAATTVGVLPAAPARKRYLPYGDDRNTVTFTGTDHRFLGQPDDTTGLTYLNNRYYDPAIGVFTSVDPLVGKTGTPYLYAGGNPSTFSDPSGLDRFGNAADDCRFARVCSDSMVSSEAGQTIDEIIAEQESQTTSDIQVGGLGYILSTQMGDWYGQIDAAYGPAAAEYFEKQYRQLIKAALVGMLNQGLYFAYTEELLQGTISRLGGPQKDAAFVAQLQRISEKELNNVYMAAGALQWALDAWWTTGRVMTLRDQVAAGNVIGGACSFSAETGVLMADGTTKPISQILVGDKVLAYDPTTGERGPREVTHLWVHGDVLTELEIDGANVVTTEDHPFWSVTDGEWERADELGAGETVLASDGTLLRVGGLVLTSARLGSAYNLTVAGLHTYYVAVGDEAVLVHNDCGNFVTSPSKVANKLGVTTQEVNNAIHEMKKAIPSGAPIRNPDVTVDMGTGEVYPQISGGGLGDSIGNIFDYFPHL